MLRCKFRTDNFQVVSRPKVVVSSDFDMHIFNISARLSYKLNEKKKQSATVKNNIGIILY